MGKQNKETCDHNWRPTAETLTHWGGKGWGTQKHRACYDCSKIEFFDFHPKGNPLKELQRVDEGNAQDLTEYSF